MTKYTVAIKEEGEASAKSTEDFDAAMDWFTNAAEEVLDPEGSMEMCSIALDGRAWGVVYRDGLPPQDGEGEVIPMRKVA